MMVPTGRTDRLPAGGRCCATQEASGFPDPEKKAKKRKREIKRGRLISGAAADEEFVLRVATEGRSLCPQHHGRHGNNIPDHFCQLP
ncbi:NACHT, LRR and PYD domains-containing protein 1-like protein [Lates japonicus]|uniref:NACHT, LRR and PYD domains-containing protein 1-like protein n=1 Tax=Lates japonicus TaxID=270547 RepID=A0AAD3NBH2_LATJO|nr:NACHT, LRR and PYD domains-containing protein 1-like protein [Lates japonicus]